MATFEEFYNSIEDDKSGKKFERFVKWFLLNEFSWKLLVKEVWLWDEYPSRWSKDKGIDLIFRDKQSNLWAVQAKQYNPKNYIKKSDIDSFLSESGKKHIKGRLLIATTNLIGKNATEVITNKNTFPPVKTFLLSDFNNSYDLGFNYPTNLESLKLIKNRNILVKKDFQERAVKSAVKGFKGTDRGKLIMACGTGKTVVTLLIMEQMKSSLTLVMVPSLLLLSNTLKKWSAFAKEEFEYLCVCSDQKVTEKEDDITVNEIPLVSSNVETIKNFINKKIKKIIFCTYQSSQIISKVYLDKKVPSFDLIICDEAHRTVGKKNDLFTTILDNNLIRGEKRLFVTATPKVFSSILKKRASDTGTQVLDMDNSKYYGDTFFEYSFGEAITEEQLCDYSVIVTAVNKESYSDMIENRTIIKTKSNNITDSKSYALQLAVLKSIKKFNLRRLISFHNRKINAKKFSTEILETHNELKQSFRFNGTLESDYVDGKMSTFLRETKVNKLESVKKPNYYILSNAKCLSEGVDVPTLDGIIFVDPRKSEIDIIQIIGRAIRKASNKKRGVIILPFFIDRKNQNYEIDDEDFKVIWKIINALKSHDYKLTEVINNFRNELGRTGTKYISKHIPKFIFDLPIDIDEEFQKSLETKLIEVTSDSFEFWHGLLKRFIEREGHANVPSLHKEENHSLGSWVNKMRIYYKNKTLSNERINILNQYKVKGFVWDAFEAKFNEGLRHLENFVKKNGNAKVPENFIENGYLLGIWLRNVIISYNKGKLSKQRIDILNSFKEKGFSWNREDAKFQLGIGYLEKFLEREGHCKVPNKHWEDDFNLGGWISNKRTSYKNSKLPNAYVKKLDEFKSKGFVWNIEDENFEEGFKQLLKFIDKEGHAKVPSREIQNGYKLGVWLGRQRKLFNKNKLSEDRIKKLNSLKNKGFAWNIEDDNFDRGIYFLTKFLKREGHSRVPHAHIEDKFNLGIWVYGKRNLKKNNKLKKSYCEQLDSLQKLGWRWEFNRKKVFGRV